MCSQSGPRKSVELLKGLYKSAVFTLQAIAFLQTGRYERKKAALFHVLNIEEQNLLKWSMKIREKERLSLSELKVYSDQLLKWASKWICEV